jgi:hypothetical protein
MTRLWRCIQPFPSTTRAYAIVASFVRRQLLQVLGLAVRAVAARAEMPGIFRPCSRGTDSSRDMPTPAGEGAVACSLRPSAGGANGEAMPRARCHPAGRPGSLSLPRLAAEPGPRVLRSGFSAPPYRGPTRLPRIQSTIGDQSSRLDHWPASRRRRHRGLTSALRPPLAVAPLREVNDGRPRPGLSPSCRWAMPSSWSLAAFPWTHRRDASNPLLQPTFRVTSTRSENTCNRCFNEHDRGPLEHPCRDKQQGWPPLSIDRCLSIDGYRRRSSRSGVEDHRASTFPSGIAPERDFAPTPIASDTSCRGHCLSPCLESTRVTGEAAGAASASKARVAGGWCVARFPRRNPTSSRPRCLPSQGRPRT